MKQNAYLLGAESITREATADKSGIDFCKVTFAVENGQGGLSASEYFYGKSSQTKAINNLISQNGGRPVPVELDLTIQRDFKTGANVARLENFTPIKG